MVFRINKKQYYIIAEIGMNHDGDFKKALALVKAAKNAGVDAVKFQMHIAEEETLKDAPTPPYFKQEDRFSYFQRTAFTEMEWRKIKKYCHNLNLDFIVSPFSIKAAKILKKTGVDAYKIASGEVTNHPMLEYITKTGIPILLSSGMSDWTELKEAVNILKPNLKVLFQCSSQYPCEPGSVGLNIIEEMASKYPDIVIGFSDHTLDNSSSIAALVKGAEVFEKHFTLSKNDYGPDAKFSLEPDEMKNYVDGIKFVSEALSSKVDKNQLGKYKEMKKIFEKSIVAAKDLPKGRVIKITDLNFKKPGNGIRADKYENIVNKISKKSFKKDEIIKYEDLT